MMLSREQLRQFDEDGFLYLPGTFTGEEAAFLRAEVDRVYRLDREEIWRESSGEARTAFAAHTYSEPFRRLGAHPRLVEPVMQVLDGPAASGRTTLCRRQGRPRPRCRERQTRRPGPFRS